MRKFFFFATTFIFLHATAQNFYFPKTYYTDSSALSKNIPLLAKQVMAIYKETPDTDAYLNNLFRFQIVARQYADAVSSLQKIRSLKKPSDSINVKVAGFSYMAFATAKIKQAETQAFFSEAYRPVFLNLFNPLSEKASVLAAGYFDSDIKMLRSNLDKLASNRGDGDSINLDDAKALCKAYNSYNVYSQVIPLSKPLLTEVENKNFIIEDSVLIKTRDGAFLSAIIIRKRDLPGKQPVVFVFNIYNSPRDKSIAKETAINGYIGVVANTRGKRLSPQEIEPFEHDAKDAYDIIDWISKQSWCNGKVGMFGGSYLGFSQWAAVKNVHPVLKTIIPQVAVGIGVDYPMTNNVFMSYMLRWIHYVTNSKETDEADFGNGKHWDSLYTKWYVSGKPFRSLDTIEKRPSKIFQRWLMHPGHDAYWQNMVAYKTDFAKINIPILTTTGYYDADQLGAMYYFKQHHLYNKKANHYLVIGPYDHGGAQSVPSAILNGYKIDSVANISITDLAYQWFNYILKDSAKPALLKDKINYEVMGANEWKHAPSLNKMNNDTIRFYLSNTRVSQHYKLDTKKAASAEFIRQEVDFKDRSDTIDNSTGNLMDSVIDISNGLSFVSEPFKKEIEINGAFTGELKASISKKDMDIIISLYEWMPDGKYFGLSNFIGRASYAKNDNQRQLLQPGKIETIPFDKSFFVSKKIAAGSKLIIVVGVSKNSSWQINYGTGKDVSDESIEDAKIPLEIKWYNTSVIKVPVYR